MAAKTGLALRFILIFGQRAMTRRVRRQSRSINRILLLMLKRISVRQLTVGMHIKEFCGSWMEHPFIRASFVLSNAKDLNVILASSIKEVWIDSNKGLDVPASVPVVSEKQAEIEIDAALEQVALGGRRVVPLSIEHEMERAALICSQSKQAMVSMFEEVRMGNSVD
ncbi:MAG: DUF3391 domain-containing protein, partial [Burkholderiales bacterium]|nr:DUF3391 domain-containing protein [Burkholderiales bacterium]